MEADDIFSKYEDNASPTKETVRSKSVVKPRSLMLTTEELILNDIQNKGSFKARPFKKNKIHGTPKKTLGQRPTTSF